MSQVRRQGEQDREHMKNLFVANGESLTSLIDFTKKDRQSLQGRRRRQNQEEQLNLP